MNVKRTFGAILTILGIIGLIYTGVSNYTTRRECGKPYGNRRNKL
jgi:hypothetical protein